MSCFQAERGGSEISFCFGCFSRTSIQNHQYDIVTYFMKSSLASLIAQLVKNPPAMQETLHPWSGRSAGEGIGYPLQYSWASFVAQLVKKPPAKWETWVQPLGWEDPLEKGKATHSSILAYKIMDCIVHGVAKSQIWLSDFYFHFPWVPACMSMCKTHFYYPKWSQQNKIRNWVYSSIFCEVPFHNIQFYNNSSNAQQTCFVCFQYWVFVLYTHFVKLITGCFFMS